jgi:hypothetical protein
MKLQGTYTEVKAQTVDVHPLEVWERLALGFYAVHGLPPRLDGEVVADAHSGKIQFVVEDEEHTPHKYYVKRVLIDAMTQQQAETVKFCRELRRRCAELK